MQKTIFGWAQPKWSTSAFEVLHDGEPTDSVNNHGWFYCSGIRNVASGVVFGVGSLITLEPSHDLCRNNTQYSVASIRCRHYSESSKRRWTVEVIAEGLPVQEAGPSSVLVVVVGNEQSQLRLAALISALEAEEKAREAQRAEEEDDKKVARSQRARKAGSAKKGKKKETNEKEDTKKKSEKAKEEKKGKGSEGKETEIDPGTEMDSGEDDEEPIVRRSSREGKRPRTLADEQAAEAERAKKKLKKVR